MAYDHEEQAQLDNIKAWWKQYGTRITWGVIAVILLLFAWKFVQIYQAKQVLRASVLYEELQMALDKKDKSHVLEVTHDLQVHFARTSYAQMASSVAAKMAFDAGDMKQAKVYLSWVIEHSKTPAFESLARIRLAGILLDEKAYGEALAILKSHFPPEFMGAVADRKGDILVAQKNWQGARVAYQEALAKSSDNNPTREVIQLKLDGLGHAENIEVK